MPGRGHGVFMGKRNESELPVVVYGWKQDEGRRGWAGAKEVGHKWLGVCQEV